MQLFTILSALGAVGAGWAFDMNSNSNLAIYWGQNEAGDLQPLGNYCPDDVYDTIMLGFLDVFHGPGGQPSYSFSDICSVGQYPAFDGTNLAQCSFMSDEIKKCQSKGKTITLSLGGGSQDPAPQVGFTDANDAHAFADLIWDEFLGGSSDTRPLGDAVLDGIDLDVETGPKGFYDEFVKQLRSHMSADTSKKYIITAAPQCPLPDGYLDQVIRNADLDAVYVQFYNNPDCAINSPDFNIEEWDRYLQANSHNKNIKMYLGAASSPKAAGIGAVDVNTLTAAIKDVQGLKTFGGTMLFEITDAQANNRIDIAVKTAMTGQPIQQVKRGTETARPRVRSRLFRLD